MAGYEIKPAKWLSFDFKELWRFRELFYFMAWRDIKVKYRQTLLGFLWVVLQPLIMMLIFSIIWTRVLKFASVDLPYPLFAFTGLIFWGLFSSAINSSGDSMIANSNIIKKVYFPRLIIPSSAVITALFDFLVTMAVFILMVFFYGIEVHIIRFLLLITLSTLITIGSAMGIGLIIASLTITYRDFRYITPFFLQAFFFLTPIIYPLSLFGSENLKFILSLNPLAGAITIARSALMTGAIDWIPALTSVIVTVFLLTAGLLVFHRMESHYSDSL